MLKPAHKTAGIDKARVLIVEDQPIVREKLVELINGQSDLVSCGNTADPRIAIELIPKTKPTVIITGLALQESHGLEFLKDLHVRYPRIPVLVFSMYDESLYGERAIRAGATGFVSKHEPTKELLCAIRRVLGGEIYLSERVTAHAVRRLFARSSLPRGSELEELSDRELEVLELIGQGRSSRQIASVLHLDLKTIETYRSRIKVKLKLSSATELAQYAQQSLQHITSSHLRSERRM
jgi:DNA-binding NarL/FixJ family response regulator